MKRLVSILSFLAMVAGLYLAAVVVLGRLNTREGTLIYRTADYYTLPGRGTWYQLREFDPGTRYDAIIIGSSHAYRGYDPRTFMAHGHTAFNLGSPSQSPLNSYVLLDHYVHARNTGLVVFDIFEGILRSDALESGADHIANAPGLPAAAEMARHLGGIKALNMLAVRATGPLQAHPPPPDRFYHGLGFGAKLDSAGPQPGPATGTWNGDTGVQYRYFLQCMDLCRARGIPVVVTRHYARAALNNEEQPAFAQRLRADLGRRGIRFLDFSRAAGVNESHHFVDHGHLNLAGARLFTGQLVDSLEQLGYLPHKP